MDGPILPSEILVHEILPYLWFHENALRQCTLVCKSLSNYAQSALFEEVAIYPDNVLSHTGYGGKIKRYLQLLESSPKVSGYTKKVQLALEVFDTASATEAEVLRGCLLTMINLSSIEIFVREGESMPYNRVSSPHQWFDLLLKENLRRPSIKSLSLIGVLEFPVSFLSNSSNQLHLSIIESSLSLPDDAGNNASSRLPAIETLRLERPPNPQAVEFFKHIEDAGCALDLSSVTQLHIGEGVELLAGQLLFACTNLRSLSLEYFDADTFDSLCELDLTQFPNLDFVFINCSIARFWNPLAHIASFLSSKKKLASIVLEIRLIQPDGVYDPKSSFLRETDRHRPGEAKWPKLDRAVSGLEALLHVKLILPDPSDMRILKMNRELDLAREVAQVRGLMPKTFAARRLIVEGFIRFNS